MREGGKEGPLLRASPSARGARVGIALGQQLPSRPREDVVVMAVMVRDPRHGAGHILEM